MERLAKQRIGNELRANAGVPVVQQKAVATVKVAALLFHKGIDAAALLRRQPYDLIHSSTNSRERAENSASVRASSFRMVRSANARIS